MLSNRPSERREDARRAEYSQGTLQFECRYDLPSGAVVEEAQTMLSWNLMAHSELMSALLAVAHHLAHKSHEVPI